MRYTECQPVSSEMASLPVSGRTAPATVAQQCAECVHSYKGMLPEELTLESIRQRAAEGRLPCMVSMNPPAAGTCPMFRPLAPDGDMLDLVGADEDDGVSVDEHGTVTIEVR